MKLRLHEQARSGTSEADFRTAAIKKACRQYRAARWFLLPEAEFAAAASRRQIANMPRQINNAPPPEGHIIHELALPACEGCLWPQAAESAEFQIRLDNKGRQLIANLLKPKPGISHPAPRRRQHPEMAIPGRR